MNTQDNATDFRNYEDYNSNNLSISYAISDTLSVSAESVAAKGDQGTDTGLETDYKYDRTSYGVDYTIASGVALTASYSDYTQAGTNSTAVSGSSTMVRVKFLSN